MFRSNQTPVLRTRTTVLITHANSVGTVCLIVCQEHNSKPNDPGVSKHGVSQKWHGFGVLRSQVMVRFRIRVRVEQYGVGSNSILL